MALGEEGPGLGSWGGLGGEDGVGVMACGALPVRRVGCGAFLHGGAQQSRGWTLDHLDHLGSDPSSATYWLGDLNKLIPPSLSLHIYKMRTTIVPTS